MNRAEVLLRVIVIILAIFCCSVFGERNFWDNKICTTDADCSNVLDHCDSTFGCKISEVKLGLLFFGVVITFIIIVVAINCIQNSLKNNGYYPHNQYLPQTVSTYSPPHRFHQYTQHCPQTVSTTSPPLYHAHGAHHPTRIHRMHGTMIPRIHHR